MTDSGPLRGVRVVDASRGIAGPKAAMLLADFGADVIKVEAPEGDPARSNAGFAMWNRNKRGMVIDLEAADGRRRLDALLQGADIAVFSESAGALRARGLDGESVGAGNPGLIYLHMPPFDEREAAPWAGDEESAALLAAATGIAAGQYAFEDVPVESVYPHALYGQAIWGAGVAVGALLERERSGLGQTLTVGGLHGMMMTMTGQLTVVPGLTGNRKTAGGPGGAVPWYRLYQCGDGEWVFLACLTPKFYLKAFEVLGVLDMLADERLGGEAALMMRGDNIDWAMASIAEAFRRKPRDEWMAILNEAGCPTAYAGRREDWLDHQQVVATGLRAEVEDPERGTVVMPGLSLKLTRTPGSVRCAAPTLGQDNDADWADREAPSSASGAAEGASGLGKGRGPLAGFRVIDLGTIIAGTHAGSLLAELGADVVKVEPPTGDPLRGYGPTFAGYNKGKRGLVIDLRSEAGREAFYALVKRADAVIDNYRPGVLQRLGIDYDSLRAVNPSIVTASVTGFGEGGPEDMRPGMDPMLQAMSGMMHAQGGDSDPVFFTLPVNDVGSASMVVLGIVLALFEQGRSGEGQRVWTSLAGQGAMMQSGELVRFEGRPPPAEGGRDYAGASALDRFYATQDGWIRLQASGADLPSLQEAGLLGEAIPEDDAALAEELAEGVGGLQRSEVMARLREAEVPAAPVRLLSELAADPELEGSEMQHLLRPASGGAFWTAGRYARLSRTQRDDVLGPPGLGEHSVEVLREAGLDEASIAELIAAGTVVVGEPFGLG